jgi:hypothetical protein
MPYGGDAECRAASRHPDLHHGTGPVAQERLPDGTEVRDAPGSRIAVQWTDDSVDGQFAGRDILHCDRASHSRHRPLVAGRSDLRLRQQALQRGDLGLYHRDIGSGTCRSIIAIRRIPNDVLHGELSTQRVSLASEACQLGAGSL